MIRWILLKLVGIFLPSLISKAVGPTSKKNSSNPLNIEFKVLDKELGDKIPFPSFSTSGSAALDLRTNIKQNKILTPGETFLFSTGFAIHINNSKYAAFILPRSGLGHKNGIVLGNLIGLIDSDYQGEIMVSLWNRSNEPFEISPGDRIAQMMFIEITSPNFKIVSNFASSERGGKGFGSSGRK